MARFRLILISFFFFCTYGIFGQTSTQDSLRLKGIAAMMGDTLEKKDSSKIVSVGKIPFKINPKLATKKSAVIPGWGQAYAKQYWFIPVIYIGFGASTFGILYNAKRYQILKKAYFETSDANKLNPSVTTGKFTLNNKNYELSIANLKQYTNYFRRNRDLSWLSIPVVWAVNILEINVAAHLKSFDMSDDISMKIEPSFEPTITGLPSIGGRVIFAFK